jgi:plasmid stabilization system protein ParE
MKKYEVLWSHVAEKDLAEVIGFIASESVPQALSVLRKIRNRGAGLYSFPERGRIVPELHEQGISVYRELITSPWRIVYRISEGKVYVLSVLDSRRNMEDILLRRLVNLQL